MSKTNIITGWFTTEDGIHVPIYNNETKAQALDRKFGSNYSGISNIDKTSNEYNKAKENIHKTIKSMDLVMGEKEILHKKDWVIMASGVKNKNMGEQIIKEYFKRD